VLRFSKDGESFTKFSELSPFFTRGLCVTSEQDVLVCVSSTLTCPDKNCKIVRLNGKGEVTQDIQYNKQSPMFSCPCRVTSLPTGDVVVVDVVSDGAYRVICTDRDGNHRYTWTGEVGDRKVERFSPLGVTHDNNNVYITDNNNHCVYVLDRDGKAEQFRLDKKHGIKYPLAITIDNRGRLWLGCGGGKLYVLE